MGEVYTLPNSEELKQAEARMPHYMRPNRQPFAVVYEGYLDDGECDAILAEGLQIEPYKFTHCNASATREFERDANLSLRPVETFARQVNELFFEFNLDPGFGAWMQEYRQYDDYNTHVDAAPGSSRKLTAVVMLTSETAYFGGNLEVIWPPESFTIPRTRGTIVVFPGWLHHRVMPMHSGTRYSLNMGFWGPPFK
jgi:predicted 2-oxoglutarate/Fe(II)-dependent dioxygenase YbiX